MKTKKVNIELEEVKVVKVLIEFTNPDDYKSKWLALKNHERETREILAVRNFYGSNDVEVVFLIDDGMDESEEVKECRDWIEYFTYNIKECEVETAYIIDRGANGISDVELDFKGLYFY